MHCAPPTNSAQVVEACTLVPECLGSLLADDSRRMSALQSGGVIAARTRIPKRVWWHGLATKIEACLGPRGCTPVTSLCCPDFTAIIVAANLLILALIMSTSAVEIYP